MEYIWPIVQILITAVVGVVVPATCGAMRRSIKRQQQEDEAVREGVKAILHDRLYSAHAYYMAQGYCPLDDKRNIRHIYEPYAALGGNGTGLTAYEDIKRLPTSPQEIKRRNVK